MERRDYGEVPNELEGASGWHCAAEPRRWKKAILAAFAKWQIPADQNYKEFLSRIDGEGGFAVIDTDNQAGLLDGVSKFTTWLEFDIVPVVDIMDGVSVLAAGADFRESV